MEQRERKVHFNGKNIEFVNSLGDSYIEKINNAIQELKDSNNDEVLVSFNLGELMMIRRFLVLERVNMELCRDNLIEGINFNYSKRESDE